MRNYLAASGVSLTMTNLVQTACTALTRASQKRIYDVRLDWLDSRHSNPLTQAACVRHVSHVQYKQIYLQVYSRKIEYNRVDSLFHTLYYCGTLRFYTLADKLTTICFNDMYWMVLATAWLKMSKSQINLSIITWSYIQYLAFPMATYRCHFQAFFFEYLLPLVLYETAYTLQIVLPACLLSEL